MNITNYNKKKRPITFLKRYYYIGESTKYPPLLISKRTSAWRSSVLWLKNYKRNLVFSNMCACIMPSRKNSSQYLYYYGAGIQKYVSQDPQGPSRICWVPQTDSSAIWKFIQFAFILYLFLHLKSIYFR